MLSLKVCGVSSLEQAKMIAKFDEITHMGIILAPSVRQVKDLELIAKISHHIRASGKHPVGVFVDSSKDEIFSYLSSFDVIQLHIKNSHQSQYESLKQELNSKNIKLWLALSVGGQLPKAQIKSDMILYDAAGALAGGNGTSFSWDLLKAAKAPFGLAGGIGADNILKAARTGASLLDLNSRLELSPGIKDEKLIKQAIQNLKEAK